MVEEYVPLQVRVGNWRDARPYPTGSWGMDLHMRRQLMASPRENVGLDLVDLDGILRKDGRGFVDIMLSRNIGTRDEPRVVNYMSRGTIHEVGYGPEDGKVKVWVPIGRIVEEKVSEFDPLSRRKLERLSKERYGT